MTCKKYVKKIEIGSDEWIKYQDINFDPNLLKIKTLRKKRYMYIYLNQKNRNIFKLSYDTSINYKNIDYFMLRDYQKNALIHILSNKKVILNLPVRFGKSYLAVTTTILNNKKNSILFVDPNMIEEFRNIFYMHGEKNVFIYYKNENIDIFEKINDLNYKIIITTEETFISRFNNKKISSNGLKNIKLIKNVIIDEYHNFVKKSDSRYGYFRNISKKYFDNVDIFVLMSATPTNEYIFNVFYAISLLDIDFVVTDWLNKCSISTKDYYERWYRTITNYTTLEEIIKDALYVWKDIDPFNSLIIKEEIVEQPKKIYSEIYKEKNITKKQKINDDHRLNKEINYEELPIKIDRAISILKENKDKKVVIFTYFKESEFNIKEDLKKNNINSEYINSDVSIKNRIKIIERFQKGDLNIVIVEIKTAIGITLDKADMAIIICDEYEPQKYYQALGRIISTNLYELKLKHVYWIYDKVQNSKQEIVRKLKILDRFGINYSPFNKKDVHIYLESHSDKLFMEKLINKNENFKLFNRNRKKFNPELLLAFEEVGLDYIFIHDNDNITKDTKVEKYNLKHISYNELFNVDMKLKNIEEVLQSLNCYKKWQIDIINNCDPNTNLHYREFISCFEDIDGIDDNISKNKLTTFLIDFIDKDNNSKIIDDLYCYIKQAILYNSNDKHYFMKIKNVIKSYFMKNIEDDFFENYSTVVINNLNKKLNEYRLKKSKLYFN